MTKPFEDTVRQSVEFAVQGVQEITISKSIEDYYAQRRKWINQMSDTIIEAHTAAVEEAVTKARADYALERAQKHEATLEEAKLKGIEEYITVGYGKRCKTKDTDDFPELKKTDPLGRCANCEQWEQFDIYKAQLKEQTK